MNLPVPLVTVGLLIASNLFMTIAWYGHLPRDVDAAMPEQGIANRLRQTH